MKEISCIPRINDIVTVKRGIQLCQYFGFENIVQRIKANPNHYAPWKFDGCSGIPDELLWNFSALNWEDVTLKCCLPHDLEHAYGVIGDEEARKQSNINFKSNLRNKTKMEPWLAQIFYKAVQIGGCEKLDLPFSWGFAYIGGKV